MQPNYLERVKSNRDTTSQAAAHDGEQATMLAELKKMQMAALMGSQGKSTVILTDQTDLGDKIQTAIKSIELAIQQLDSSDADSDQLAALKKLHGIFDGYFKRVGSDQQALITAIKGLDVRPVIEAPVVNVPAPKVTVNSAPVDLTGVERAIEKVLTPVSAEELPADRCDLSRYRAQDLYETGDLQYVGFVNPEGNWYIIENDVPKNRMRYVFGTSGYARHFRAAATYEYKLLDKAYNATA